MTANPIRDYSVLMAVWKGDDAVYFCRAVNSMLEQTLPAKEIVIVCDGELTSKLNNIIDRFKKIKPNIFKIIRLKQNRGLGNALSIGVSACSYEYIARMDADDFSLPNRIEVEMQCFAVDETLSIVGSNIDEYQGSTDNVISHAVKPELHEDIERYAHRRNPMCHMTLLFKRSDIIKIGNYKDFRRAQDYELIARALSEGLRLYNVQEPLVKVKADEDYFRRRGGFTYFRRIARVKVEIYKDGFYSFPDLLLGLLFHSVSCIVPNSLREWIYKALLRRKQ